MSPRAQSLHANPWAGVFQITGGGADFVQELMGTPGASKTVLQLNIPYASSALADVLGHVPHQACSSTTARQLGMAALERAQHLAPEHGHLFGLGLTASLATNRTKKGAHRAHWVIQTELQTHEFHATFDADRAREEARLNDLIWHSLDVALLERPAQDLTHLCSPAESAWRNLLHPLPIRIATADHDGKLLLPGSFNPLHDGHRQILTVGEQITGLRGAYELTVKNADKPGIDFLTLSERLDQFDTPVWVTNVATFAAKAELFPGVTFLVGVDTVERIGAARFYADSEAHMLEVLSQMQALNTRFVVFGRDSGNGFKSLDDLRLPDPLEAMCQGVPETDFRNDISSTELRNRS